MGNETSHNNRGNLKKSFSNNRLTIGLLWPHLAFHYSVSIYRGITKVARDNNVNTICFTGGSLNSTYGYERMANVLYDIAGRESIDGLIMATAILGNYVSEEEMFKFCHSFQPLPLVSIGMELEGCSSVLVDNYKGMYDLTDHLITHHNHRRICFLKGPEDNPEANNRFQAYRDALRNHGITLDPALVFPGDFRREAGTEAVRLFLDERKLDIKSVDSIICANDDMASYVIREFHKRGYEVPGDIGVAGFDNIGEDDCMAPTLTSVDQPFYKIGCRAAQLLLDRIAGKKTAEKNLIPTEIILRQSCGCATLPSKEIIPELYNNKELYKNSPLTENPFLEDLNSLLSETYFAGVETKFWKDLIMSLRIGDISQCDKQPAEGTNNWLMIRKMVTAFMVKKLQIDNKDYILRNISAFLLTAFDIDKLLDYLTESLPKLDIKGFYLSLYKDPPSGGESAHGCPQVSRLILAYNEGGKKIGIGKKGRDFPTVNLVPEGIIGETERLTLIVKPLFFLDNQIGFMVLETESLAGHLHETLQLQLSNTLRGIMQIKDIQENADKLAAANNKISHLNEQLKDENIRINTEMKLAQRIQTALLPRKIKNIHPELEISAYMIPAEKVGGDYYDVAIDKSKNLWLGIGDVSGHGVTPGLIMMIAQTVHTTITTNFNVTPREIVNMVNKVLFKNVHNRLHTGHFMSFTTLKYLGKGNFQHAGIHLDLIVYKKKEHKCIQIETKGTFLNFLEDIDRTLSNEEFHIDEEDILVLYTDGITEARDSERKFLDFQGLIDLILKYGHQDIESMGKHIIRDVLKWCDQDQKDDMSLVLVRRIK